MQAEAEEMCAPTSSSAASSTSIAASRLIVVPALIARRFHRGHRVVCVGARAKKKLTLADVVWRARAVLKLGSDACDDDIECAKTIANRVCVVWRAVADIPCGIGGGDAYA